MGRELMGQFITENLDRTRFIGLAPVISDNEQMLAKEYARKWTCSIAADQNAQTRYRNWRKDQQEHAGIVLVRSPIYRSNRGDRFSLDYQQK